MEKILTDLNFTHWMWYAAMMVFLILEMIMPGIAFLWLAAAAGVTGTLVLVFSGISWETQIFIFTILSVISVLAGRRYIQRSGEIPSENEMLNKRGDALIGRRVKVVTAITDGRGRVKIGDSIWTATGTDTEEGSMVTITAVNGAELSVE